MSVTVVNRRGRDVLIASINRGYESIGINQYRHYERGEVPNVSNGRMIRSIMNPKVRLEMVESSKNELSQQEYDKKINNIIN